MRVAKTKVLISFTVTAKLICVFVFAYADCWFSHEAAHFCVVKYDSFLLLGLPYLCIFPYQFNLVKKIFYGI